MKSIYDFIIIGTGPAGLAAAMTIAKSGKKALSALAVLKAGIK